jgi:hypothetical protein
LRSKKYVFEIYSDVLVFNVPVINVLKVGGIFQKNNRRGAKGREQGAKGREQGARSQKPVARGQKPDTIIPFLL